MYIVVSWDYYQLIAALDFILIKSNYFSCSTRGIYHGRGDWSAVLYDYLNMAIA